MRRFAVKGAESAPPFSLDCFAIARNDRLSLLAPHCYLPPPPAPPDDRDFHFSPAVIARREAPKFDEAWRLGQEFAKSKP
jgi:hypothetical protein